MPQLLLQKSGFVASLKKLLELNSLCHFPGYADLLGQASMAKSGRAAASGSHIGEFDILMMIHTPAGAAYGGYILQTKHCSVEDCPRILGRLYLRRPPSTLLQVEGAQLWQHTATIPSFKF
jgi:hypothetical protein